ncbi:MAG: methyl-accepting chemotaxis protein [Proteobacteria bacterium]|nr:methyl-accepting chemotaxis protein [Pseudomonadota bacterium]
MQWFANQRTAVKLTFGFASGLIIMLIAIWVGYSTITLLEKANKKLFNKETLELQDKVQVLLRTEDEIRTLMLGALLTTDRAQQQKYIDEVKGKAAFSDEILRNINQNVMQDNRAMILVIGKLQNIYDTHKKGRKEGSIPLIYEGKMEEAKSNELVAQKALYDEFRNTAQSLTNLIRDQANEVLIKSGEDVKHATTLFIFLALLAVVVKISWIFILNRQISTPLNELSIASQQMAKGDLKSVKLPEINREDEVGVLVRSFYAMNQWINEAAETAKQIANGDLSISVKLQSSQDFLGASLQQMINNLRKITQDITEGVNLLGSSATEISAASSQLAASAAQTATSVNETTTTIEEVRQTSHVANQKAQLVTKTAENTTKISDSGKRAASAINSMIDEIQNQMNLIAESMVRLSEQTQAIGAIITTVDDLSQQSNLLSVNASIEAAKAGDQGKGFAVVAQEVKSLASQSKQATNQVRAILADIQKATSASVMATEQGSKAVDEGVKKSEEAGESILMLVKSVSEASNAASQIAASSKQQLVGMEQATLAMENIRQTSNQNVDSSKQLEASVRGIIDMGARLKNIVGQFKLNDSASL